MGAGRRRIAASRSASERQWIVDQPLAFARQLTGVMTCVLHTGADPRKQDIQRQMEVASLLKCLGLLWNCSLGCYLSGVTLAV